MCKHLFELSRFDALRSYGRYYDTTMKRIVCFPCGTAPDPTKEELAAMREEEKRRSEEDKILEQAEGRMIREWLDNTNQLPPY